MYASRSTWAVAYARALSPVQWCVCQECVVDGVSVTVDVVKFHLLYFGIKSWTCPTQYCVALNKLRSTFQTWRQSFGFLLCSYFPVCKQVLHGIVFRIWHKIITSRSIFLNTFGQSQYCEYHWYFYHLRSFYSRYDYITDDRESKSKLVAVPALLLSNEEFGVLIYDVLR